MCSEKKMQNRFYLVHLIVTSILILKKIISFRFKIKKYELLKFEFFENERERKFDLELEF